MPKRWSRARRSSCCARGCRSRNARSTFGLPREHRARCKWPYHPHEAKIQVLRLLRSQVVRTAAEAVDIPIHLVSRARLLASPEAAARDFHLAAGSGWHFPRRIAICGAGAAAPGQIPFRPDVGQRGSRSGPRTCSDSCSFVRSCEHMSALRLVRSPLRTTRSSVSPASSNSTRFPSKHVSTLPRATRLRWIVSFGDTCDRMFRRRM